MASSSSLYAPFKDSEALRPRTLTKEINSSSVEADARAWNRGGFTMGADARMKPTTAPSLDVFYETDAGAKRGVATAVLGVCV